MLFRRYSFSRELGKQIVLVKSDLHIGISMGKLQAYISVWIYGRWYFLMFFYHLVHLGAICRRFGCYE